MLVWCGLSLGSSLTSLHAQDASAPAAHTRSNPAFDGLFVADPIVPDAPASTRFAAVSTAVAQDETIAPVTSPPRQLFSSLYVGLVTTQVLDIHSTLRALDAGHREANPLARWATGNPVTLVAFKTAATAGTMVLVERVRRKHPMRAAILLAAVDTAYAFVVAHNYRVPVPGR